MSADSFVKIFRLEKLKIKFLKRLMAYCDDTKSWIPKMHDLILVMRIKGNICEDCFHLLLDFQGYKLMYIIGDHVVIFKGKAVSVLN
jgi:hypothetical protein